MLRAILIVGVVSAALCIDAFATGPGPGTRSLEHAEAIRSQVEESQRARGQGLAVTEATSTSVLESFMLLTPSLLEMRFVAAGNGIYYAICPVRVTCPYPARHLARPAADVAARGIALELAVRTFLETSADVVAVSLPTARFVAFIVERAELAREVDLRTLADALAGEPGAGIVDRLTRGRVFLALGLERTLGGGFSWAGMPRWPTAA